MERFYPYIRVFKAGQLISSHAEGGGGGDQNVFKRSGGGGGGGSYDTKSLPCLYYLGGGG